MKKCCQVELLRKQVLQWVSNHWPSRIPVLWKVMASTPIGELIFLSNSTWECFFIYFTLSKSPFHLSLKKNMYDTFFYNKYFFLLRDKKYSVQWQVKPLLFILVNKGCSSSVLLLPYGEWGQTFYFSKTLSEPPPALSLSKNSNPSPFVLSPLPTPCFSGSNFLSCVFLLVPM